MHDAQCAVRVRGASARSSHAPHRYVTPRPHAREEVIIFGGVIGREVHSAFFTLDVRDWKEEAAEQPRETWAQIDSRLRDQGREEHEISVIRQARPRAMHVHAQRAARSVQRACTVRALCT